MTKNMIQKSGCFFFTVLLLTVQYAFAQSNSVKSVAAALESSQKIYAEKMFVHTDKSFYTAGEIIWFKAYNTNVATSKLSDISKVAYVEILDKANQPVLQTKIELAKGTGSGSLLLPATINSGNYIFRAYTNWMKNFDASTFFQTKISIINPSKSLPSYAVSRENATVDVQFFPEGGELIADVENNVAFKVTLPNGKGADAVLNIYQDNTLIAENIRTYKFGMGSFNFKPAIGTTYTAKIRMGDGTVTKTLPIVKAEGIAVNMSEAASSVKTEVRSKTSSGPVSLLIHTKHGVIKTESKQFSNDHILFSVDKTQLQEGMNTFTFFDANHKPVAERLYFKRPATLQIKAATDKMAYETRSMVTVNAVADNTMNASLSVYRADALQNGDPSDITAYMLLTSELKGTIEDAGFYFSGNEQVGKALNLLLLTQGWRKFEYQNNLTQTLSAFKNIPEYEGHIISAKVTDKNTGLPVKGVEAYLTVPGKYFRFANSTSNAEGILYFNFKNFYGSSELIAQAANAADSNYKLEIQKPYSVQPAVFQLPDLQINEANAKEILDRSINTQVENVFYQNKRSVFYQPTTDSLPFYGRPDNSYLLDDYTRFRTMEEVLREYVPEVGVRKRRGQYYFVTTSGVNILEKEPIVLLDGVPFLNADTVISFDPLKIKKLEVIPYNYELGPKKVGGIVSFSTYKNDMEGFSLDPAALLFEYDGLQVQRQFYSPVYENDAQRQSRLPDARNVLYWEPDIRSRDSKTQFSFYTSDVPGKYIGVINGISPEGQTGNAMFYFEVKNSMKQ